MIPPRRRFSVTSRSFAGRLSGLLLAPLILGLAACSHSTAPPPASPKAWPSFAAAPGVTAVLKAPAEVPRRAILIDGEVTVSNAGGTAQMLHAPTACDIEDWRLRDASGRVVAEKHPEICAAEAATRELAPGASLTAHVFIALMPGILQGGQRYTIDYRFWGQRARASFTAE